MLSIGDGVNEAIEKLMTGAQQLRLDKLHHAVICTANSHTRLNMPLTADYLSPTRLGDRKENRHYCYEFLSPPITNDRLFICPRLTLSTADVTQHASKYYTHTFSMKRLLIQASMKASKKKPVLHEKL